MSVPSIGKRHRSSGAPAGAGAPENLYLLLAMSSSVHLHLTEVYYWFVTFWILLTRPAGDKYVQCSVVYFLHILSVAFGMLSEVRRKLGFFWAICQTSFSIESRCVFLFVTFLQKHISTDLYTHNFTQNIGDFFYLFWTSS